MQKSIRPRWRSQVSYRARLPGVLPQHRILSISTSLWRHLQPARWRLPQDLGCLQGPFSSVAQSKSLVSLTADCRHVRDFASAASVSGGSNMESDPIRNNNTTALLAVIESSLPPELREPALLSEDLTESGQEGFDKLLETIAQARRQRLDVLANLGLEQGRWDAVHWIVKRMLDHAGPPPNASSTDDVFSNIEWSLRGTERHGRRLSMPLDSITATEPFVESDRYNVADDDSPETKLPLFEPQRSRKAPRQKIASLDSLVDNLMHDQTSEMGTAGNAILGEIWIALGNMILAASKPGNDGNIMPNVLRIIASLHHNGWIPDSVYHTRSHNADPSALQQPPLLSELSRMMLQSLSEAVYLGEPEARASIPAQGYSQSRLFKRVANKVPDLAPEIWLEFCLWSCVHGGWVNEGCAILYEVRSIPKPENWSLINWRDILESPDEKWEEFSRKRMAESESKDRRGVVERTISIEVVAALVNGLVNDMLFSVTNSASLGGPGDIGRLKQLKGLLDRDFMNLGISSWDAIIQRIASTSVVDIETNPTLMDNVLDLTQGYGKELRLTNAPKTSDGTYPVASYVFDATAAVIGLHHRSLHAYVKGRDVNKAIYLLRKLQQLTDENKQRSMRDFFAELAATSDEKGPVALGDGDKFDFQSRFAGVKYPAFFPNIPPHVLADLLDLLTDTGHSEVVEWMLHSKDVDGPLIPESMYDNQLLAPALVRYAASISDADLLSKLTRAQGGDVSGPTLVAVCHSRIRSQDFSGAVAVLDLIHEHSFHKWRIDESVSILQSLLLVLFDDTDSTSRNYDDMAIKVIRLIQQLLRGEHGLPWGERRSQLDTVLGVLSSISPELSSFCSGQLQSGSYYRADMDAKTFNKLLETAVRCLGPDAGREVFENWCRTKERPRTVEIGERDVEIQSMRASPAQRFGSSVSGFDENAGGDDVVVFDGVVDYNVDSIRTVIDGVLRERRSLQQIKVEPPGSNKSQHSLTYSTEDADNAYWEEVLSEAPRSDGWSSEEADDIMEWAVKVLREDFRINRSDIDYVTQGYFLKHNIDRDTEESYSPTTLQLSQALASTRKQWARAQEERVRQFAQSREDRQLFLSQLPAVELRFLQSLARDFGLDCESIDQGESKDLKIVKPKRFIVEIPDKTIEEVVRSSAGEAG